MKRYLISRNLDGRVQYVFQYSPKLRRAVWVDMVEHASSYPEPIAQGIIWVLREQYWYCEMVEVDLK